MPQVAMRRIQGAGWSLEPKRYERELRKAVEQKAKPAVLRMCQEVVAGKRYSSTGEAWKHKISFRSRFQIKGGDATLYVYPHGKNKELWTYTSRGTKPHPIDAKNAPYLIFPYGGPKQQPKTRPFGGGGPILPGFGQTKWARVKHVDHPGTKPRMFEEQIEKDYRPEFRKLIRGTIDRLIQEKNRPYVGRFGI